MKTRSSSPLSPSLSPSLSHRPARRRAPAPRVAPAGPRRLGLLSLLPLLLGLACGGGAKDEDTSPTGGADGSADGSADGTDGTADGAADGTADGSADGTDGTADGTADGGDGGGGLDGAAAVAALEAATAGLYYTSESDYPLVVVQLADPGLELTVETVRSALAPVYESRPDRLPLSERSVEEVPLAQVFDRYTVEEPWWEDYQREAAPQWQALRDIFELQLSAPQVFRLGPSGGGGLIGDIDIFVLGRASDGDLVGFRTIAIET